MRRKDKKNSLSSRLTILQVFLKVFNGMKILKENSEFRAAKDAMAAFKAFCTVNWLEPSLCNFAGCWKVHSLLHVFIRDTIVVECWWDVLFARTICGLVQFRLQTTVTGGESRLDAVLPVHPVDTCKVCGIQQSADVYLYSLADGMPRNVERKGGHCKASIH